MESSHGTLTIDMRTGVVLSCEEHEGSAGELSGIYAVDLSEYFMHYRGESREDIRTFDILDIGLFYVSERGTADYQPPEHDWRQQISDPKTKINQ